MKLVVPRYTQAQAGIQALSTKKTLETTDPGFAVISEIFLAHLCEQNDPKDVAKISIQKFSRGNARLGFSPNEAREVIPINATLSNGQTLEWNLASLTTQVDALLPIIVINSLFQDPAHLIPRELDGLDMGIWSYEYSYNPYLAFKVVISLLGGSLTSNDGSTEVRMPAGTTTDSIKVVHTPLVDDGSGAYSDRIQAHPTSQTATSASDLASVGHAFGLTAEFLETGVPVTSLLKPYEITFRYADDEVENVFEDSLALYWWNGSEWVAEPTSVLDEENNTVTATPEHLGNFAVLGIPKTTVYLPLVLCNR